MSESHPLLTLFASRLGAPLPGEASALLQQAKAADLPPGTTLLRAGECWQHLWWLERGLLRLYYLDRDGLASNKNFYLEGAMLWPITPMLRHAPVHFWIEALQPCRIWPLAWKDWHAAIGEFRPWRDWERQALAALLEEKMLREQQFLQCSATERYLSLLARQPDWIQRIPLRHLASYLGITDVALSRIRRRLNPG